jgi:hypothetical protein
MTVGSVNPFKPLGTITLAASTTPASATLPLTGDSLRIVNTTSAIAYIALGKGTATATTGSYPVPPGAAALIAAGPYIDAVAVVLESGSGSVFVTVGEGTQV